MWPSSPGEESPEGRAAVILTPDQRVRVFISLTLEELAAGRTAPRRAAGARTSARSSTDQPGRCLREAARCPGQQCDYITFLEAGGRRRTVTVCRGHLQAIATEGGAAGARACNRGDDDGPIRPDDRCQLVASRPARRGHLGKSDPPEGRIRTDSSPGKVRKTPRSWTFAAEPPWCLPWESNPQTYALRGCSCALLAGLKPAVASREAHRPVGGTPQRLIWQSSRLV